MKSANQLNKIAYVQMRQNTTTAKLHCAHYTVKIVSEANQIHYLSLKHTHTHTQNLNALPMHSNSMCSAKTVSKLNLLIDLSIT